MNNSEPNLNMLDKLILLALEDNKGEFVSDSISFGYCIAAAAIYELSIHKRIEIVDNKVHVINPKNLHDDVLNFCFDIILSSKKDKSLSDNIGLVGNKVEKIKKLVLTKLIKLKIIEEKEKTFLWIFKSHKYPTTNELPEKVVRKRLHDIIENKIKAADNEIMLISLVNSSGLNKEVFGKDIAKHKKDEIDDLIKNHEFADSSDKLIQNLHDTLLAAIILLMTTSTVTLTS